jgi:hypothetical protein
VDLESPGKLYPQLVERYSPIADLPRKSALETAGRRHGRCPLHTLRDADRLRQLENREGVIVGKQMEGDNRERRQKAKQAHREGKTASEVGASQGASKQRTRAEENMTHQEKIDLQREGKHHVIRENTPEARPGSRDADTLDREDLPRLS